MDAAHWDEAYGRLGATGVSWFSAGERTSLELIGNLPALPASAIDVGGGASGLGASMRALGVPQVSVLGISAQALEMARAAAAQDDIQWLTADVRAWQAPRTWDLWHDRAVFHFMVSDDDRHAYRRALSAGLAPGGHVIAAAFAPEGPEHCSGLPVKRYAPDELVSALGDDLTLVTTRREVHVTPSGREQPFTWVLARRLASSS